jgi:hypothetical protein
MYCQRTLLVTGCQLTKNLQYVFMFKKVSDAGCRPGKAWKSDGTLW